MKTLILLFLVGCGSQGTAPAPEPAPAEKKAPAPQPELVDFACKLPIEVAGLAVSIAPVAPARGTATQTTVGPKGLVKAPVPVGTERVQLALAEHAEVTVVLTKQLDGSLSCASAVRPLPAASVSGTVAGNSAGARVNLCGRPMPVSSSGSFQAKIPADTDCEVFAVRPEAGKEVRSAVQTIRLERGKSATLELTLP